MMNHSIKEGLASIRRQRRLFLLLWAWTLLLGLLATLPAYQWWNTVLGSAPEADRLLDSFSLRILGEMTAYDQNSIWGPLVNANGLLLLLALLASPLIAGGTLEILTGRGSGPTVAQFGSGAGRYFWRFLRLMILGGITMVISMGLLAAALGAIVSRFSDAGWEATSIIGGMAQVVILAIAAGCFTVVLDYARIRMVLEPTNRSMKCLFSSLRFVFFRAPGALAIAAFFGVLAAAAWLACFGLSQWLPVNSRMLILVSLILMQGLLLVRCALRVGVLAAATHYSQAKGWVIHPQQLTEPVLAVVPAKELFPETASEAVESVGRNDELPPNQEPG
jgi:hypothetical protein